MARKVASNAFWNLVSLGSGALVSVGIPPFLTRLLPAESFGAWALVLQVAGYVNLLSFGMQTVVARHIAIADQAGDRRMRDAFVSTGFWILTAASGVALLALAGVVAHLDALTPGWSAALQDETATAILIVGAALAVGLPATALAGHFVGLQRNDVPAAALATMRLMICVGVIATAHATRSLVWMAWAYFVATLAGTLLQGLLWARLVPSPTLAWAGVTRRAARALRDECLGLTVWSVAMLLISGLSLLIVARLDLPRLPYFAVAATLVLFMVGMVQALASAILPVAAQRVAAGDAQGLSTLLGQATRFCAWASLVVAAPLVVGGTVVLSAWVGPAYAAEAAGLLAILTVGHCLRMTALPYVTAAVAAGLQQRMLVLPLVEGALNLTASVLLGVIFGAHGVAFGTLVGAIWGVGALFVQHPLRAHLGPQGVLGYLRGSVFPGLTLLGLLAAAGAAVLLLTDGRPAGVITPLLALATMAGLGLTLALRAADRQLIASALTRQSRRP